MTELSYKTRGNSSPQGKQRVYFSCHPDDFDKFFDDISSEILSIQNCAIYFDKNKGVSAADEELFTQLSQMQLFVIPVTTKFLTKDSRSFSSEFKFAIENHIPVLPLMQESGLESVFNEKCGDLQFLDKNNRDATALSYDEKLKKFLESVLIGDETAKKIREAFDAYVFLSYRKKDRKYAQELMRLIHKHEFCRDIAIWYDEFLVPGENFNNAISDALVKSKIFALAVTPSLLEDGNYVMTTEYPMAKEAQKPILPAEIVPTDREKLNQKYIGLPECANAHDDTALSDALMRRLSDIAVRENDDSPEHNFFIGLAYLGGVDVEVDHERALGLITFAANAGLREATAKLVAMYRSGEGVQRSYETAIEWQKKLVEQRRSIYIKSGDADDGHDYIDSLWALGDYYTETAKLADAKAAYETMKTESERLAEKTDSFMAKRDLAASYGNLGDIAKTEGNIAKAQEYYLKFSEIAKQISDETGTVESKRDLSVSYNNLGDIAKAEGNIAKAKEYYLKSFEISKQIADETGTVESKRSLSVSYEKLGDIVNAEGNIAKAKEYYLKSLEMRKQIADETGTVESKRDLSISYNKLGDITKAEGNIAKAQEYYLKFSEIAKQISDETGTVESKRDLSISYDNLGFIAEAESDLSKAKEYYLKSYETLKQIADETGTFVSKRDLSISYERLGDIAEAEGNIAKAKECALKALEIWKQIADETGIVELKRALSLSYERLGDIAKAEGNITKAKEYYLKSLEISEQIADETDTVESKRDLSVSYERLGDIAEAEGNIAKAKEYYLKDLEISKQIADETGTIESKRDLSVSYEKLGDIARAEGDISKAKEYYLKSLEIRKQIADETGTVESKRDLSVSYERLGDIAEAESDLSKAREYYLNSFEILKQIADNTGTVESYDDLAVSYYKLGTFNGLNKEMLTQAYNIWKMLNEHCPDYPVFKERMGIAAKYLSAITPQTTNPPAPTNTPQKKKSIFSKLFGKNK